MLSVAFKSTSKTSFNSFIISIIVCIIPIISVILYIIIKNYSFAIVVIKIILVILIIVIITAFVFNTDNLCSGLIESQLKRKICCSYFLFAVAAFIVICSICLEFCFKTRISPLKIKNTQFVFYWFFSISFWSFFNHYTHTVNILFSCHFFTVTLKSTRNA